MAPCITALVEERRGRVRVELDGKAWRTLPAIVVVRAGLSLGIELDRLCARTLRRELRRLEALEIAARALGRRDHSSAALDAHLERRGLAPAERSQAVEVLQRARYLDDERFASERAAALAARGYGDAAVRNELEREGVGAEHVEAAVYALVPERERAVAVLKRSRSAHAGIRRLVAKGFSADTIESVVAEARIDDGHAPG
jgi:SOS response regulatory protein OraA/RecX